MNNIEIDSILQQTPCICGAEDTWHIRCFIGKSEEQVKRAYSRVYTKIRKRLKEERIAELAKALETLQHPDISRGDE